MNEYPSIFLHFEANLAKHTKVGWLGRREDGGGGQWHNYASIDEGTYTAPNKITQYMMIHVHALVRNSLPQCVYNAIILCPKSGQSAIESWAGGGGHRGGRPHPPPYMSFL